MNANSKESYPIPGPGSQFHDKKSAQIYKEEDRELVVVEKKDDKKKSTTSKAERVISFINYKSLNPEVGPGKYPLKESKVTEKGPKFRDYQKLAEEKKDKDRERVKANDERAADLRDKIGEEKVPKFPQPIPADRETFEKYQKQYGSDKDRMKRKITQAKGRSCDDDKAKDSEASRDLIVMSLKSGKLLWRSTTQQYQTANSLILSWIRHQVRLLTA